MNLTAIAIRRPVFTVMVMFALVVLGLTSLSRLGTDLFPDVSVPVVSINVIYPGASPSEVETLITKPIEDAVVSLNGLDRVTSSSRESLSTVVVLFKLGTDVEEAATQVRERVSKIRAMLPSDIKEPTVSRIDTTAIPVLQYTVHSKRPLYEIRDFADDVIRPALEQVDGVAQVTIQGGAEREIQVDLDQAKIDALGLTPAMVSGALAAGGVTVPAGRLTQGAQEISVRTVGDYATIDSLRELVVTTARDGSAVRLSDIAHVQDGFAEMRTRMFLNGDEAVAFEVVKQSGRNTVAVADAVRKRIEQLRTTWPADIETKLILDQAVFIRENAHEVEVSIIYGGAMAILIILVFMLDLRSMLISALALPTSVIATFFVMYLLDFTLNMMTLLGLSLAIGLLIDDAVVVRENIFKHLERGQEPRAAALEGTKEIALAVLATTLTVVAVFAPVAFMGGMVGQFFKQFGLTVSAAVIVSLFVAFTLDPMLSSRFSKPIDHEKHDAFMWLKRPFLRFFAGMDAMYAETLRFSLKHKAVVGIAAVLAFVGMIQIAKVLGADFVAPQDRAQYNVDIELPAGTSLDETTRINAALTAELRKEPLVTTVLAKAGANGDPNRIFWRVLTVPKQKRSVPIQVIQDYTRRVVGAQAGAKVSITDVQMIEGAGFQAPIMLNVRGEDYATLTKLTEQVTDVMHKIPGVTDVDRKYSPGKAELQVSIDRARAADLGLPVAQVAMALRAALEGDDQSKLRQGDDEVPIRVRLREEDRKSEADVLRVSLASPKGVVSLADVARLTRGDGPQEITREDRVRQIAIWAAPHGRSLGDVANEMKTKLAAVDFPPGYSLRYDGQIKQMNETNESAGLALLLGVVFIYIVLASQFESFIHPLTIMLTLPLAMIGAIVALFLSKSTMSMGSMIGIILLMGLVTKNAILLVDRAIERVREHGDTPAHAILAAGPERLRPILMTSAAMVLGMLPTALSRGEGSEFRAPMAIAVIGGVISSTFLSLLVVPAFYLAIENGKARLGRILRGKGRRTGSVPAE